MHSKAFLEDMEKELLKAKTKLENDLSGLSKHTELGSDTDANAEEVSMDEVSRDLITTMSRDLEKINKALRKIADGSYGVDDEGNLISEQRLRALPWADKAI